MSPYLESHGKMLHMSPYCCALLACMPTYIKGLLSSEGRPFTFLTMSSTKVSGNGATQRCFDAHIHLFP